MHCWGNRNCCWICGRLIPFVDLNRQFLHRFRETSIITSMIIIAMNYYTNHAFSLLPTCISCMALRKVIKYMHKGFKLNDFKVGYGGSQNNSGSSLGVGYEWIVLWLQTEPEYCTGQIGRGLVFYIEEGWNLIKWF